VRAQSPDKLGGTNQTLTGIGMYSRGLPPISTKTFLHVATNLALLSCKDGTLIAMRRVTDSQNDLPIDVTNRIPVTPFNTQLAQKPFTEWTAAEYQMARQAVQELPRSAWWATVSSMLPKPR